MRIVIVGAGLAAAHAVEELRSLGHQGSIDLFGAEPHLPYNRPPLSKGFLLGNEDEASIFVHDDQWYADQSVELHLGTRVTAIDLDRGRIVVGADEHGYDRLLLTTGSTPRHLPAADESEGAVAYLRTLEDSHRRWKATHVTLASRMLGDAPGSGHTSGVEYLRGWVDHRLFWRLPELGVTDASRRSA